MVFAERWNGSVRAISPGDLVSTLRHKVAIPVIDKRSAVTLYLVNQSRLFAHFTFPSKADSIVVGEPHNQSTYLIRPDVNVLDRIPDFILPPSTYHWSGVPDAR